VEHEQLVSAMEFMLRGLYTLGSEAHLRRDSSFFE